MKNRESQHITRFVGEKKSNIHWMVEGLIFMSLTSFSLIKRAVTFFLCLTDSPVRYILPRSLSSKDVVRFFSRKGLKKVTEIVMLRPYCQLHVLTFIVIPSLPSTKPVSITSYVCELSLPSRSFFRV